jgi:hypothetical protein
MRPTPRVVMTIPLRLLLPVASLAAGVIGVLAVHAVRGDAAPVGASPPAARPHIAAAAPIAIVAGSVPGSSLTLLEFRRTGPKVVSARLRIAFEGGPNTLWVPAQLEDERSPSAEAMRLIDEVNGREHFVLHDADGECLCSGAFEPLEPGRASVISAKFPAPPADVRQASLETPGFPSFDAVPLS